MADTNVSLDIAALPKQFTVLLNATTSKKIYAYSVLNSVPQDIIFLALSHPAHNLFTTLDRLAIRNNMHFIDTVSKRIDSSLHLQGCEYLYSSDYNDVLKAIEKQVQTTGMRENVLFVDALHHWLLQKDKSTALLFLDFLHKRLKLLRLSSIFLVDLEKLHSTVRKKVEEMSDRVITL